MNRNASHQPAWVMFGASSILGLLTLPVVTMFLSAGPHPKLAFITLGVPAVGYLLLFGYFRIVLGAVSLFAAGSIWLVSAAFNAGLVAFAAASHFWVFAAWPCVALLSSLWGLVLELHARHEKAQGVPGL